MSWVEKNRKINNGGGGTIIWDSKVYIYKVVNWLLLTRKSKFSSNAFEAAEFWCIVGLTTVLFITKEKFYFSLICSFYFCLVKGVERTPYQFSF